MLVFKNLFTFIKACCSIDSNITGSDISAYWGHHYWSANVRPIDFLPDVLVPEMSDLNKNELIFQIKLYHPCFKLGQLIRCVVRTNVTSRKGTAPVPHLDYCTLASSFSSKKKFGIFGKFQRVNVYFKHE